MRCSRPWRISAPPTPGRGIHPHHSNNTYVRIALEEWPCNDQCMPRVSQDHLEAPRRQILDGSRKCFARFGYEGATVRRLEEATGLSRGAIFHHFKDKESLFLALAEDDATRMADVVAEQSLVQVMRNLLRQSASDDTHPPEADWLGTRLEVSRRLRTDEDFRARWAQRSEQLTAATRARRQWPH